MLLLRTKAGELREGLACGKRQRSELLVLRWYERCEVQEAVKDEGEKEEERPTPLPFYTCTFALASQAARRALVPALVLGAALTCAYSAITGLQCPLR